VGIDENWLLGYNYLMMIEKGSKMAKMTYGEVESVLKEFTTVARAEYGSDSYACGYLTSYLVSIVGDLPAHKQREFARGLESTIKSLTKTQ
jgi:hypothetical protein